MQRQFYIYLALSLVGIFILLLLSSILQPKLTKIRDINENSINQRVKVQGIITGEKNYDNDFSVLTLQDKTASIQVTCNCQNLTDKEVEIIGRVTEYKQELQIQADKIVEISD